MNTTDAPPLEGANTTADPADTVDCCAPGIEVLILPFVFSFIVLLGCLGNILVIIVVVRNREQFKNTTNLFVLNLAIADLFFLVFCVPFHAIIYTTDSWPLGELVCKLVNFAQYCGMATSIGTLVAMSFDRFLAVCFPLQTKHLRTPRSAFIMSLTVWAVAVALAAPHVVVYKVIEYKQTRYCVDSWTPRMWLRPVYFLVLFVVTYAVPAVLIAVFSALTVLQLWLMESTDGPSERRSHAAKRRVTKLIAVIVIVFSLCWIPSHVIWLWTNYFPETLSNTYTFYYGRIFAHVLSYANSSMNPIIYAFLSSRFRRGFRRALRCRRMEGSGGGGGGLMMLNGRYKGGGGRCDPERQSTYRGGRFSSAISASNRQHTLEEDAL